MLKLHQPNTQVTRSAQTGVVRGAGTPKGRIKYKPAKAVTSKRGLHPKWSLLIAGLFITSFFASCTTKLPKAFFNAGVDSVTTKLEKNTPKVKFKFEKDKSGFYYYAGSEMPKPTDGIVSTILKHNPKLLIKANILPTSDSTIRAELFLNYSYFADLFKSGISKVIDDKQPDLAKELRDMQKIAASAVIDSLLYKLESRTPKLEIEFRKDSSAKSVSYHYAKDRNGLVRGFVSTNTSNASLVCVEPFLNYQFIADWVKQEGGKIIDKANTELKAWVGKQFPKKSKSENVTGSTKKLPDPGKK